MCCSNAASYQGRRADTYERNLNFPFDPASIDAVVLSHAHIDHSGNIPNLAQDGFRGNIWCTSATRNLCTYMLMDSGHIQEQDVLYVNKKRARDGEPPVEPLYTQRDVTSLSQPVYRHRFRAHGHGGRRRGCHLYQRRPYSGRGVSSSRHPRMQHRQTVAHRL